MTALPEGLKPCPFCGGVPEVRDFRVHCRGCGAFSQWRQDKDSAIAAWNRRAPDVSMLGGGGGSCSSPDMEQVDASKRRHEDGVEVSSRPDMQDGRLCFHGTRLTVAGPLSFLRAGYSDEAILREYPTLTVERLAATRELLAVEPSAVWRLIANLDALAAAHLAASNDKKAREWSRKAHAHVYSGIDCARQLVASHLLPATPTVDGGSVADDEKRHD